MAFSKSSKTNGYIDEPEMVLFFNELAPEINTSCRELGIRLGLDQYCIESLAADYPEVKERAYQTLIAWFRKFGRFSATIPRLARALENIGNKLLAERCEKKLQEWEHEHKSLVNGPIEETAPGPVLLHECPRPSENDKILIYDTRKCCIEAMDNVLNETLTICLDDVESSDKTSLFQRMRFLEKVQAIDSIQKQMITNYKPYVTNTGTLEWVQGMQKNHRIRSEQEQQTQKLIHECLFNKPRPKSDIPRSQKTSSYIDLSQLGPRSSTEGSRTTHTFISQPFATRQTLYNSKIIPSITHSTSREQLLRDDKETSNKMVNDVHSCEERTEPSTHNNYQYTTKL